jgi:hypothetical protein
MKVIGFSILSLAQAPRAPLPTKWEKKMDNGRACDNIVIRMLIPRLKKVIDGDDNGGDF